MTTAAVIIIGNEILSGKFADENGPYAIRRLRELGVDLERMVVIPDTPEVIAAEVSLASQRFDWVFTSGGVGPTHDDVTLESVAAGLGESLVLHPDLLALLDGFGIERTPSSLRMARVPESTRLIKGNERGFPVVLAQNVAVLPGVPRLFRSKFEQLAPMLEGTPRQTARLYTSERETDIAARLSGVVADYPAVVVGSYPRFGEGEYRVIVTVESRDLGQFEAALESLANALTLTAPIARDL